MEVSETENQKIATPESPAEEVITKKRAEIDRMGDLEGKGIAEEIKGAVVALNLLGYLTTNSCEGHSYGRLAPFVDMALEEEPQDEDRTAEEEKFLQETAVKNNLTKQEVEENIHRLTIDSPYFQKWVHVAFSEEYAKWLQKSAEAIRNLRQLLEEFYKNRKVKADIKLVLNDKFSKFTLHNGGENYNPDPVENKPTPKQIAQATERLPLYQKEMKEFANFLLDKFRANFK